MIQKMVKYFSVFFSLFAFCLVSHAGIYMGTQALIPTPLKYSSKYNVMRSPTTGIPYAYNPKDAVGPHGHILTGYQSTYGYQARAHKPVKKISAVVYPGSLKANVVRISRKFGWKIVMWNLPYDYNWVGKTTLTSTNVQGIIGQLLKHYPVQAIFYKTNHVVAVESRTIYS